MAKHKILTFGPILASVTLKAVSLQLNGMLMMWKIQEAKKTMPSGLPEFIPPFIPLTGMKCSYGKISSPLTEISVGKTEISGTKPARPLIWTHQNFYKGFRGEARSRKQGQPGQPGSCEKALRPEKVSIHVHPWQWSIVRDYRSSSQCLIIVLNSKTEPLFLEFKWCKDKFKLLNKRLQVG